MGFQWDGSIDCLICFGPSALPFVGAEAGEKTTQIVHVVNTMCRWGRICSYLYKRKKHAMHFKIKKRLQKSEDNIFWCEKFFFKIFF